MMKCIFVIMPKECSFTHKGVCNAPEVHILTCAGNHKRLALREGAKEVLIDLFTRWVVDSPFRVKVVAGQAGRDILDH